MKRIEISRWGAPEDVADVVERPDLPPPGAGEVLFDVLLFPLNPADYAFCRGSYRLKPPLPATPGAECVGRVRAVGSGVIGIAPGDLVINLQRENWASQRCVPASEVIGLPAGIKLQQAAMLRINPPTASLLLSDIAALKRGDWVIQNVGNSAVGRLVIRFAKARGLRTLNVVRRNDVFDELSAFGADACLMDGSDLAEQATRATGGAPIVLGLDAIAGDATARIAACVSDSGHVCVYGAMSGDAVHVPTSDLVYRGVTLTGFMLGRFLARRTPDAIRALYADLAQEILRGEISAPVDRIYPIEDIANALRHAQSPGHHGKILVAPNGHD